MDMINFIIEKLKEAVVDNIINWIITGVITYFTVKSATRQYYNKIRKNVSCNIMEQGLRSILKLNNYEELPDNAKVIFVEYKGISLKCKKKNGTETDAGFLKRLRKTVVCIGGDTLGVSPHRPINYGVLGIANLLKRPILFDFTNGELLKYDSGEFEQLRTEADNGWYYYKMPDGKPKVISAKKTSRNFMIAIPIEINRKLVGGITFDMKVGAKTIYQRINESDSDDEKNKKIENNKRVLKEARRTALSLIEAYFMKKGGEKI